jgi:hypothetical protein
MASSVVHHLPFFLQQANAAAYMQAMLVDSSPRSRGGYVLAKALGIFNSFSTSMRCTRRHRDGKSDKSFLERCEKLMARPIKQDKLSKSSNQQLEGMLELKAINSQNRQARATG